LNLVSFKKNFLFLLRWITFLLLLPFSYFLSLNILNILKNSEFFTFIKGCILYTFLFIFFSPIHFLFKINKIINESIFKFFSPLMKVSPFLFPSLLLIMSILFKILILFFKEISVSWFLFLLGFLYSNHLLISVTSFKKDKPFINIDYLFNFLFIFIFSTLFLLLCLRICISDFSLISIINSSISSYLSFLKMVFSQLFSSK